MSRVELLEAYGGRAARRAVRGDGTSHSTQTRDRDIKNHADNGPR
jgi:hypothetical protein